MKRTTIGFLLALLAFGTVHAIPVELWEQVYSTGGSLAKGMDVQTYASDDAIHALVIKGDLNFNPSLVLDKVDANGALIWETEIVHADSSVIMNTRVLAMEDGGAVVTYSLDWYPQWHQTTGPESHALGIARVDNQGNIVWNDTSMTLSRIEKQVRSLEQIGDTLVFTGWWGAGADGNGGRTAHITKYTLDGQRITVTLVQETHELSRVADAEITPDAVYLFGSLVAAGEFIARVDHSGNILWTLPTQMDLITEACLGHDGYIYFTGMNSNQNYMVASINPQTGTYRWQRIFEEGVPNPPSQAIVQRPDGRIALWKNNLQLVLIAADGTRLYEGGTYGEPDEWDSNAIAMYTNGDLLLSSSGILENVLLTRVGDGVTAVGDTPAPAVVTEFALAPAHPNPFNAMTTLRLALPETGSVQVFILDILGRTVDAWTMNAPSQGVYDVSWNALGFASGLYFVRAVAPDGSAAMRKLVLIR